MSDKTSKQSIIERNFSKSSSSYDDHSSIQLLAAEKLMMRLDRYEYKNILEIGCGTGHYTLLLKKRYPESKLTAVDMSPEMIYKATEKLKGYEVNFLEADGETMKFNERFDLITSNAVFHWFRDLGPAVKSYKGALQEKGSLVFSFFGPQTFNELSSSIKSVLGEEYKVSAETFLPEKAVFEILKNNFSRYIISEEKIKGKSSSLMELLAKIRQTGTRGVGVNNPYLFNKETLSKIEESYIKNFGSIVSTYQVFFCEAYL